VAVQEDSADSVAVDLVAAEQVLIGSHYKMRINSNKWGISKDLIIREYIKNKKSLPQISKEYGVPYETLFWYKKKLGIVSHSMSSWNKGKRLSPNTEFKKGILPWNKGTKGIMKAWNKGKLLSEEHKKKVSISTKKAMKNPEILKKIQKTQFSKGIVPWNKGKVQVYSNETINKIRNARLKQIFPKLNTNIERILFDILKKLEINAKKQIPILRICQSDAFIEPNIVLFADGDYWHCNPKFYPKPKTQAQIKNIIKDKVQNNRLIKNGFIVKRFWEHDLINNRDKCEREILQLTKR
jgi:G:T-mismatch repair DNA endonuclease (very short patch repair protein)